MHDPGQLPTVVPDDLSSLETGGLLDVEAQASRLLSHDASTFDAWVVTAVSALRDMLRDGPQPPVMTVLTQTPGRVRVFESEICCPVAWMVRKFNRQVLEVAEPWVAAVLPGARASTRRVWGYSPLNAPMPGYLTREIRWYVEARGRGVAAVRAGTFHLAPHGPVGAPGEATLPSKEPILGRLLRGHPDRRRHRLR